MSADRVVNQAIRKAVTGAEQDGRVAKALIAWLDALATGNESLDDKTDAHRRLERIFALLAAEPCEED